MMGMFHKKGLGTFTEDILKIQEGQWMERFPKTLPFMPPKHLMRTFLEEPRRVTKDKNANLKVLLCLCYVYMFQKEKKKILK